MQKIADFNLVGLNHWERAAETTNYYAILSAKEFKDPKAFWSTNTGITKELLDTLKSEDKFLDLGCGFGRIAHCISSKVKEYHGVDYSQGMIEKAKEFHKEDKNVFFQVNNGRDLREFDDGTFDVVYTCLVFQHMFKANIFSYIKETRRVLKPGGIFFAYNIPVKEKYGNCGFVDEDLKVFEIFSEINKVKTEYYYNVIAKR